MSTIKSDSEDLTLNAHGSGNDILFQSNGSQVGSLTAEGVMTSTTFAGSGASLTALPAAQLTGTVADARISALTASKLTGALPAISGANLTGVGVAGITSSADATAITINSSEQVGIGTGSPAGNAKVHIYNGASGQATASNNTELTIENSSNTGIQFLTPNTAISGIWFGDPENKEVGRMYYTHSENSLKFFTNASERLRIDGDGLKFNGDTAAANALDDYEEGTYNAVISGSTSGTFNMDSNDTLAYTKVGRIVSVQGYIGVSSGSVSGNLRMTLPFTPTSLPDDAHYNFSSLLIQNTGNTNNGQKYLFLTGDAWAWFYKVEDGGSAGYMDEGDVDSAFQVAVSFTYITG